MSLEDAIGKLTKAVERNNELLEQANVARGTILDQVAGKPAPKPAAKPKPEEDEEPAKPTRKPAAKPKADDDDEAPAKPKSAAKGKALTAADLAKGVAAWLNELQPAVNDDDEPIGDDGELLDEDEIAAIDKKVARRKKLIRSGLAHLEVEKVSELTGANLTKFAGWLTAWQAGETVDFDEE